MNAIIQDGGRQLKVSEGATVDIDYRAGLEPGNEVEFGEVLYLGGEGSPRVGTPKVEGARVVAEVVDQVKGPKLVVFKLRRRKNSKTKAGHRQKFTRVRIKSITG